jgi:hypothetical protein
MFLHGPGSKGCRDFFFVRLRNGEKMSGGQADGAENEKCPPDSGENTGRRVLYNTDCRK